MPVADYWVNQDDAPMNWETSDSGFFNMITLDDLLNLLTDPIPQKVIQQIAAIVLKGPILREL